jgi:hypothetical protein
LVGDPDVATQQMARLQTDYPTYRANQLLTVTALVQGTLDAQSTNDAATQSVLGTQNALETEASAQQTQDFGATLTAIAHLTEIAVPPATDTPTPTPTFVPVFVEELTHPGNVFAVNTKNAMQAGRLYQFCFSGTVNLTTGPAKPSDIDHVNGVAVPLSGCLVLKGDAKAAVISCGQGDVVADDPGGFTIQVFDLGPA